MSARPSIPILADAPSAVGAASACSACAAGHAGPVCRTAIGEACAAAELSGPSAELQRLLAALGQRLGFAPDAPELGGVRRLRVQPGEVELHLALQARCGAAERAEAAFDTLRTLLPDTDIYVMPVAV